MALYLESSLKYHIAIKISGSLIGKIFIDYLA
jgi:hypothetical protein